MKDTHHIKPQGYQAHLFCNFHRRADHATKECYHIKNIIQYLHDKAKFKFDHEVLDEVLHQHKFKPV